MKDQEDKNLKTNLKNFFDKYGYNWNENWWKKYKKIINTYNNWSKDAPPVTAKELYETLNRLKDTLQKNKEYFKSVSRPDLFSDTKDPDFEEFCKNLTHLVDCLGYLESYTDSLSNSIPPKSSGRPEDSRFKNLVNDIYTVFKELDPERKGLTYNPHSDEDSTTYKGPLFDLVYISIQKINAKVSTNTESLGKAIQRALEVESFVTVEKPFGDWKTPEEWRRDKIQEMEEEGLSYDDIAEYFGISRSKVSRLKSK